MDELDIMGYNYIDRLYGTNTYVPEHARFPHRLILAPRPVPPSTTGLACATTTTSSANSSGPALIIWARQAFPAAATAPVSLILPPGKRPATTSAPPIGVKIPCCKSWLPPAEEAAAPGRDAAPGREGRGGRAGGGGGGGGARAGRGGGPPAPSLGGWNGTDGAPMTVRAVANCDEVELFLNDTSLGRHPIPRDAYYSDWTVPYAPGVLTATGYRAGQKVATRKLTAIGAASRLQITPLPSPVTSTVSLYEITVVDDAGQTVLNASQPVTVKVEGEARLIGLDTGDLAYGGLFKTDTRTAYQGRLLATVQRTAPTGEIRLTATAAGLQSAEKAANP